MFLTLLDRLGEWNPQLFREIKGRLTRRNAIVVSFISLVGQFLLLVALSEKQCLGYAGGECADFYWKVHWPILFAILHWMLPLILLVGGVHTLIIDLAMEQRRGTLNFIRLSPQSSQKILTGKMLGVPIQLYLGIALAVPLHGFSGLASGGSLGGLLGFYTLVGAGCCLCYSAALLLTLLGESQATEQSKAWGGSFLALAFGGYYIGAIASYKMLDNLQWFFLPIGREALLAFGLAMLTVSFATYWMWQAANRRFRNPNSTLLSKPQSYCLVGGFEVWLLGWFVPQIGSTSYSNTLFYELIFVSVVNSIVFLFLIGALSPHRQTLQDWARYRHQSNPALRIQNHQEMLESESRILTRYSVVQDLIWGEKSPAVVAIALNLAIALAIWVPWVLLWPVSSPNKIQALAGLLLSANLMAIYALIAQLILSFKGKKQGIWAVNTVIAAMGLPPVILGMLSVSPATVPAVWLASAFPWVAVENASAIAIFLAILAQWSVQTLLSFQLTRQLRQAGESASKALLVGS